MNSGKVPVNVLKRSVLRQLKNKRSEIANSAGLGADCAVFAPFSEGQLVTCVQEGVVELQCENDLAEAEREDPSVMPMRRFFQKCANNLATAGAEPVAAELVIFLPESVEEPELKALMSEAEGIAAELNIQIIGGQTRVSSAVRQPLATVTGYGIRKTGAVQMDVRKKLAGQDIIITTSQRDRVVGRIAKIIIILRIVWRRRSKLIAPAKRSLVTYAIRILELR